jgi:hypothetical protein
MLSFVEDSGASELSGLPSWVPDFSSGIVRASYSSRYENYPHNACAFKNVGIHPRSIFESTLQLYGGYFEKVDVVVGELKNHRLQGELSNAERTIYVLDMCSRLLEFLSSLAPVYVDGKNRLEALSRTLVLDQVDKKPLSCDASVMFHDWLRHHLAFYSLALSYADEARGRFKACMQCL